MEMRMQRSKSKKVGLTALQRAAALLLAAIMVPSAGAQDASQMPSAPSAQMQAQKALPSPSQPYDVQEYAKPKSHFPNLIAPYSPRHVALPNLANTPRIDQLMHDGKLYISMNDAVALALENNLDIAIARYNLNIADTDIWRAKAGFNTILGVNNGVVQNTPGGGVGGLGTQVGSGQGGTSVGAGGAGAGTSGLVQSTLGSGPLITSFDPVITGTFQVDHNSILPSSTFSPASAVNTTTGNFSYQQGFTWGTNLLVGFNNTRQTIADAPFNPLSPQLKSPSSFVNLDGVKLALYSRRGMLGIPGASFACHPDSHIHAADRGRRSRCEIRGVCRLWLPGFGDAIRTRVSLGMPLYLTLGRLVRDPQSAAICIDHFTDQGLESDARCPPEFHPRLRRIAQQQIHLGRAEKCRIGGHMVPVVEAGLAERQIHKLPHGVALTRRHYVIVRLGLLHHQPHRLHEFARVPPIAPRFEISQLDLFASPGQNARHTGNLEAR